MKLTKQILEAILRGINLAIDDFDDMQDVDYQKNGEIENKFSTKELLELRKYFVDLGLPSGTLWGKYNVGVDPNRLNTAQDWYGGYYAWGEIDEKQDYSWATYKYANGNWNKLTKYCGDLDYLDKNSKLDNLTTLLAEDDVTVQTNKLPWNIKMPTIELFNELIEYTTCEWIEDYQRINELNGRVFTSIQNGNTLFIPAAGLHVGSSVYDIGSSCDLWSRSLFLTLPNLAYNFDFHSSEYYTNAYHRYYGFNVRPVLVQ